MNNAPLRELPLLNIENAEFVYRQNFAGVARPPYDEAGDHYFNVKVDPAIADALRHDGWNIALTKPGKDAPPEVVNEFVPEPFLKVAIGFKFRPPTIVLIQNDKPSFLTEKTVGVLDAKVDDFTKVDMVIRARRHEMQGGGYKAWLAEFYGHVQLSDIGSKYAYLLDSVPSADDGDEG